MPVRYFLAVLLFVLLIAPASLFAQNLTSGAVELPVPDRGFAVDMKKCGRKKRNRDAEYAKCVEAEKAVKAAKVKEFKDNLEAKARDRQNRMDSCLEDARTSSGIKKWEEWCRATGLKDRSTGIQKFDVDKCIAERWNDC